MKLVATLTLVISGVTFFVFEEKSIGYAILTLSLIIAAVADRQLLKDMSLIAGALVIMSLIPINTDISYEHMLVMGSAMVAIIALPYLISRYVYKDYAITFPWHFKEQWDLRKWSYLAVVLILGYAILPVYMITTGVYQNWPAATTADEITRLFVGTNALGIWDELFFICTVFVLLMRHFPFWVANILQAVLFTSFLYELGFESWGPAMIYLFALVQGYIFKLTHSLLFIVCIHLLFDFILFLVLLHAHNRQWFDIFFY